MLLSTVFFTDTPTTEIYTLSLHDALPIFRGGTRRKRSRPGRHRCVDHHAPGGGQRRQETREASDRQRSEEHTSELQSRRDLVCRLLLEKKKYIVYQPSRRSCVVFLHNL